MAEFDPNEFASFKSDILARIRSMEQILDREVLEYYRDSRPSDPQGAARVLNGIHNYLRDAYEALHEMMNRIERHEEYRP